MKIVLTEFAIDRHFKPDSAGTFIPCEPKNFEIVIGDSDEALMREGYASFCKLLFVRNWTDAKAGTMAITPGNDMFLRSEYKARNDKELPVLVRWLSLPAAAVPTAEFLCLVLYNKEQLSNEGTDIGDADYGIVAVLGQMHDQEEPINPATMLRNALGIAEGGSGVPIDREAYLRSVEFWNKNAAVKIL